MLLSHLFSAVEVCCALQPPLLLSPFPPPKMKKTPSAANDGVQQDCARAGTCPGHVGSSPPRPPFPSSSSSSSPSSSISPSSYAPSPPSLHPLYISSPPFPSPPIPSVFLSPPVFWLQALHSTWEMEGKMSVLPKAVTKIPAGCLNEHVVQLGPHFLAASKNTWI